MTDIFQERLEEAEQALLEACRRRDASAFGFKARPAVLLHRLRMRVEQKGFLDWAIRHLDAWGLEQVMAPEAQHFVGAATVIPFLQDVANAPTEEAEQAHKRLNMAWPILWAAIERSAYAPKPFLEALFKRKRDGFSFDPRWLDLPLGPFDVSRQDMLLSWHPRLSSNNMPSTLKLSPLQSAWADQDTELCLAFLANGATLNQTFPKSDWPEWTLRSAIDGVQSSDYPTEAALVSLRHVHHSPTRKPRPSGRGGMVGISLRFWVIQGYPLGHAKASQTHSGKPRVGRGHRPGSHGVFAFSGHC